MTTTTKYIQSVYSTLYTVYARMYGCSKSGRRHWRPTSNDILRVETYGADIHNIHSGLNHLADVAAGQRKIHFCVWVVYQFTYVASIINMGLLTHYKVQPVFITLTFLFVEIFKLYFRKKKKKTGEIPPWKVSMQWKMEHKFSWTCLRVYAPVHHTSFDDFLLCRHFLISSAEKDAIRITNAPRKRKVKSWVPSMRIVSI